MQFSPLRGYTSLLVDTDKISSDIAKEKPFHFRIIYASIVSSFQHLISHCSNLNPVKGKWFPLAASYRKAANS